MNTLTVDVETTGLDRITDSIVCTGWKYNDKPIEVSFEPNDKLRNKLKDPEILKIFHNAKFDIHMLNKSGMEVNGPIFDTQICAKFKNPFDKVGLKYLSVSKLGEKTPLTYKEVKGKAKNLSEIPKDIVEKYCSQDVDFTYRLWKEWKEIPPWLSKIEFPLIPHMVKLEQVGLYINKQNLQKIKNDFDGELGGIEGKYSWLNLNSPQQIGRYLISQGFSNEVSNYITNTGKISTNKESLMKMVSSIPCLSDFIRYRELKKLVGTYINKFLDNPGNIVYTNFNQCGTKTLRFSSSKPNLQNIPKRTEDGLKIRKCFIAPENTVLFDSDLSQIEPRVIAHFTQDPNLIEAFKSGGDFHLNTASMIFKKSLGSISKLERYLGKQCTLAVIYGAGVSKIQEVALKAGHKMSFDEAKDVHNLITNSFHVALNWMRTLEIDAIQFDWFITFGSKVKVFPEMNIRNYLIQRSAAEIMKVILLNLLEAGKRVACVVHDEYLGYIPLPSKDKEIKEIHEIIENSIRLRNVKIVADTKIVPTWGDV